VVNVTESESDEFNCTAIGAVPTGKPTDSSTPPNGISLEAVIEDNMVDAVSMLTSVGCGAKHADASIVLDTSVT